MNKIKDNWKIELISELRKHRIRIRILKFLEIIYHTILPIALTFLMIKYRIPILAIPLLFIILARLKVK